MAVFGKIYEQFKSAGRKRQFYIIASLSVMLVMLWAFISAGIITCNFNRSQLKGSANEKKVDAAGVIITETKGTEKYFEIYGETGYYGNEHNVAVLYNVIGNFYKDNKVSMSFQSSKGAYDEKSGTVTLYDNTYIVLEDMTSLNADKLIWSGSENETIMEGNVLIKKGGEMIASAEKGFISPGYEKVKLTGKTTTKLYGKQGEEQ